MSTPIEQILQRILGPAFHAPVVGGLPPTMAQPTPSPNPDNLGALGVTGMSPQDLADPINRSSTLRPPTGLPPSVNAQPPAIPTQPLPDPDSRMATWQELIRNFTFSLASGMAARAKNPRAGVGEALMAPFQLHQQDIENRQREQQVQASIAAEAKSKAASDALMEQLRQNQMKLPDVLAQMQANIAKTQAQTASTTQATVNASTELPYKLSNLSADTQGKLQQIAQGKMVKLGNSVFSLDELLKGGTNIQPLASGDIMMTVTPELAAGIGNPSLAGKQVRAQVGQEITSMLSSATKTTPTGGGVIQQNLITGDKTNIGSPVSAANPVQVIGPNGLPVYQTAGTAMATGATPGNLNQVTALTGQAATFNNFHSNINRVRDLLPVIDKPGASAHIAAAMAQPTSTLGQYLQGQVATGNLTNDEADLVNALNVFREDSFNLRQFFGNSPMRSDRQVGIMMSQVPSVADLSSGNSKLIERKLDAFARSVSSVESQYGPLIQLLKGKGASATPAGPGGGGGGADVEIGPDGKVIIHNNKQKAPGGGGNE